jgi:hypothetical protein
MSPEQCRGAGTVDARADIYSLGCILFEMTCGRPPFIGEGAGEILGAHQYLEPPAPQSLAPDTPPGLGALIVHMLAKRADARPQTMAIVSQTLDELLQSLGALIRTNPPWPASAQPPSPSQPPPSPSQPPSSPSQPPLSSSQPPLSSLQPPREPSQPPRALSQPPLSELTPLPGLAPPSSAGPTTPPSSPAGPTIVVSGTRTRRLPFMLGGFVSAGALMALVAIAPWDRDPQPQITRAEVATTPPPRVAALANNAARAEPAAVAGPPDRLEAPADAPTDAPSPPIATAADPAPPIAPDTSQVAVLPLKDAIELECLRHQKSESWAALSGCADQLKPLNAALAGELKLRATQESQAAVKVAAVEAALRAKDLQRARTELDRIWTGATAYQRIKARYDAAEDAAIADAAADLERVSSGDCQQYLRLLTQLTATRPPRVAAEAERRVKCVAAPTPTPAPTNCNAAALAATGKEQVVAGQLAAALVSYEAAYACKPDLRYLRKACVIACDMRDPKRAKAIWKRLSDDEKQAALGECTRNGITADKLNAP